MSSPITIPDLRFEESFKAKLIKNAIAENRQKNIVKDDNDNDKNDKLNVQISKTLLLKSILIDQIIMPFIQSFLLAGVLYYLRPLLTSSLRKGHSMGVSIVSFIKSTAKSIFSIKNK